jgi:hypothetical protein
LIVSDTVLVTHCAAAAVATRKDAKRDVSKDAELDASIATLKVRYLRYRCSSYQALLLTSSVTVSLGPRSPCPDRVVAVHQAAQGAPLHPLPDPDAARSGADVASSARERGG